MMNNPGAINQCKCGHVWYGDHEKCPDCESGSYVEIANFIDGVRLKKYQAVNQCESFEELAQVIESFADPDGLIHGRTKSFDAAKMAEACRNFRSYPPNVLTREWGIRQQAMYINYFIGPLSDITIKEYNPRDKKKDEDNN